MRLTRRFGQALHRWADSTLMHLRSLTTFRRVRRKTPAFPIVLSSRHYASTTLFVVFTCSALTSAIDQQALVARGFPSENRYADGGFGNKPRRIPTLGRIDRTALRLNGRSDRCLTDVGPEIPAIRRLASGSGRLLGALEALAPAASRRSSRLFCS